MTGHWKTTLAGAISAAVTVMLPMITSGSLDIHTVGIAGGLAAIGYLASDAE